jgi:glyoxylase-like metal-dependent hydrolase (beta-lactamase superfamily II)/rhodanese-related sulfurtransferase
MLAPPRLASAAIAFASHAIAPLLFALLSGAGSRLEAHPALELADFESASHGDSAASHEVVDTYRYPGFQVAQITLAVLSHYSYVLSSGKEAVVVDPDRDVAAYLDIVQKEGRTLKAVIVTHSHADFVAGHLEVAKAAGCPVFQSAESGAEYPFEPLKDGTTLRVGDVILEAIETPGHTPDGISIAARSPAGGGGAGSGSAEAGKPLVLFTGDTLFVGSVGRPDLFGANMAAATLAGMLWTTWTEKLSKLPDEVVILPAHGAGSLCGAHLSDEPTSTIGAEKASNPYLRHRSRSDFIAAVLDGLPEAPQYFAHNAAINRIGPRLVDWSAPLPPELNPTDDLMDPSKAWVVDIRSADEYAAGHIPKSVNIALRGRLETWVGTMVPWGANTVLLGSMPELREALSRLHRVGYKPAILTLARWKEAGQPLKTLRPVNPRDLHAKMLAGTAPIILDVRLPSEWMALRIGNVVNLPLTHLDELSVKLDPRDPIVAVCNSAYRSSLAVGILERRDFQQVSSLEGGSEAWIEAGLPVFGPAKGSGAAAATGPRRVVNLAERVAPSELMRLIMDLPGTFDLVDIRPPEHFADYAIPGAVNVDVADLLADASWLTGAGPLVIVDREGSLAMMVAGILSQRTKRSIKALHGGVEAYWAESEGRAGRGALAPAFLGAGAAGSVPGAAGPSGRGPSGAGPAGVQMRPAPAQQQPAPGAGAPVGTKKRSAGC